MYVHAHVCACACACDCVCMCVRVCVCVCANVCLREHKSLLVCSHSDLGLLMSMEECRHPLCLH